MTAPASTAPANPARDGLVRAAGDAATSPFDYIVVGSGAGGGPLACRLAEAGKRVLLLEAGGDPAKARSKDFPAAEPGEINRIPCYHAASTEDQEMSWQFSVRHYADDATQKQDAKYNRLDAEVDGGLSPKAPYPPGKRFLDPLPKGAKGGIFYPRSSGIGGCTGHHAMIIAAPNDRDWNTIADITGDDSWRPDQMRGYFARMERCLYRNDYNDWLRRLLGGVYKVWRWFALQIDPRGVLDEGGHGTGGWQPTSFIDPDLIENIAKKDRTFFEVLAQTALSVLLRDRLIKRLLKKIAFSQRVVQQIDPNDLNTRRTSPEGVFLIPTGIQSDDATDVDHRSLRGCRVGVREFIRRTLQDRPDNLVLETGVHVTRVVFAPGAPEEGDTPAPPRAIGVEYVRGDYLYEASPLQKAGSPDAERAHFYVRPGAGEVILSGGAFNTPQLLMLSGIGEREQLQAHGISGPRDAAGHEVAGVVDLPGVGRNLQDRYEISVMSEIDAPFTTLDGVTFTPGDPNDPARTDWIRNRNGLYRTNGGTLAVLKRSTAVAPDEPPDLFMFGFPAAFRGYYWGWSRQLFRPRLDSAADQHNLWSWIILKAYTRNDGGTVRLRSASPFDSPEICFHSFSENPVDREGWKEDLQALAESVGFIREINARNPRQFVNEIQPGAQVATGSEELKDWIRTQAWGHHCSCTCRMGSDRWQPDASKLGDKGAVLDSRFRVHGVSGLRVVDASVFPKIPGYFILTPIFMMAEKAADTLVQDARSAVYPLEFQRKEAAAVKARRERSRVAVPATCTATGLPSDTVGLALSGGGIRSATFALGFVQALARRNQLRRVDFMSAVSGGGFTGTFLGRLFTRPLVTLASDPAGRVQDLLKDDNSAPLWWLRRNANYIFAAGTDDAKKNLAVFWRNIFTLHLVVGTLAFAWFALAAWLPTVVSLPAAPTPHGIALSPWWFVPLLALALTVLPATLGYWLAPAAGSCRNYPPFALLAWLVLGAGATVAGFIPGGVPYGLAGLGVVFLSWIWREGASTDAAVGGGPIVRNRLTRALGEAVTIFVVLLGWVLLDTLARHLALWNLSMGLSLLLAALGPLLPVLRWLGNKALEEASDPAKKLSVITVAKLIGVPIALFLLFVIDLLAHELAIASPGWGWGFGVIVLAFAFSAAIGRAFDFLNRSSLHSTYAARLLRTFQGASNEARIYATDAAPEGRDVSVAHPKDDVALADYHPEQHGGPLHLINVCINQTVDFASERQVADTKGLPMCLTPHGVAVGRRYFAVWSRPDGFPRWQRFRRWLDGVDDAGQSAKPTALTALVYSSDPHAFHVLATKKSENTEVESLTLGGWTAVSGAAFTTGSGRSTSPFLSLFLGLANVRLGYWWNSGIKSHERPGQYPPPLWRRIKRFPVTLFRMQSLLLSEWRARFHGASRWFWYLSDGGHFDVTGLYELVRRRVPLMICLDCGEDQPYEFQDLAELTRQVRMDFGAKIEWLDPAPGGLNLPAWVDGWVRTASLGRVADLQRRCDRHAALAKVTYDSDPGEVSWLLLVKPSLAVNQPQDILAYAATNGVFPQDPTLDQIFDTPQWESYRQLGQVIGLNVLVDGPP